MVMTGIEYWLTIYPLARREINRWKRRARLIPDPALRAAAQATLNSEHLNPEAAAFFAVLASRRCRASLVRVIVDFQIAYDYLDSINEDDASAPLRNGLQLHRALIDAVRPDAACSDYYEHHPQSDDGEYLAELVRACQGAMRELPSADAIEPVLVSAVERCGQGQSRNHAMLVEGQAQLVEWTSTQAGRGGYLWWELAAAGGRSVLSPDLRNQRATGQPCRRAPRRRHDQPQLLQPLRHLRPGRRAIRRDHGGSARAARSATQPLSSHGHPRRHCQLLPLSP